jgi:drug/metabolite transporter (DMT)-like permease
METWLIYAIASLFFAGGVNFVMKVISHRNYNTSYVSIIAYLFAAFLSWMSYVLFYIDNFIFDSLYLILILSFLNTFFYFLSTLTRVKGLDNVDTTIFFPLYKTVSPILIVLISLLFFNENLNIKEIIGIIIWITIPILLVSKAENKIQKNLKLWILFVLLTSIFSSIASWFTKENSISNIDLELFVFFTLLFWVIISSVSYKFFKKKITRKYSKKWTYLIWLILWFFHYMSFLMFSKALTWNLAVVYTINSFSILIPIILSVIFYKEEMTSKKWFVIFLSILSMLFFI